MKSLSFYKDVLHCNNNEKEIFEFLISTLKKSNREWHYFVNWKSVLEDRKTLNIHLNLLNSLIGKANIDVEAFNLFKAHPEVIPSLPVLFAIRDKELHVLLEWKKGKFVIESFSFATKKIYTDGDIKNIVRVLKEIGILEQIQDKTITSLVDYGIGVEVGLDSNTRKNRGGKIMEEFVEFHVQKLCKEKKDFDYLPKATKAKIKMRWGFDIYIDEADRKIDFSIKTPNTLYLIETNFYGGGGSKLKSTAGEYKSDFRRWNKGGVEFIWITDGVGWEKAKKPLFETFKEIDYVFNLEMLERGILRFVVV